MIIFLLATTILASCAVFLLLSNKIVDAEGNKLMKSETLTLGIGIIIIISSYFISLFTLILQFTVKRGIAYNIDNKGVHNTYISAYFLAFILFIPISFIPWKSVKEINEEEGYISLSLDVKKVKTSLSGKSLLRFVKYSFCKNAANDYLTNDEITKIKWLAKVILS